MLQQRTVACASLACNLFRFRLTGTEAQGIDLALLGESGMLVVSCSPAGESLAHAWNAVFGSRHRENCPDLL